MTRTRIAFGIVAGTIAVAIPLVARSCATARAAAEAASQEFRGRIAKRAYGEIVRSAAPEFQTATTEPAFAGVMESLTQRLGAWQSADEPAWRVFVGTSGHTVTLVYNSRFERGAATEEFVWHIHHGQPALAGYHVKSSGLAAQ